MKDIYSTTIVCFGDSNTFGYDPRSWFPGRYPQEVRFTGRLLEKGFHVINEGQNGRGIPVTSFERKVCEELCKSQLDGGILFLMLGTNDLLMQDLPSAEMVSLRMADFLDWLLKQDAFAGIGHRLLLAAPPEVKEGSWVNGPEWIRESKKMGRLYRELARERGLSFFCPDSTRLTLLSDGVHFTEGDHKEFAEMLAEKLEEM